MQTKMDEQKKEDLLWRVEKAGNFIVEIHDFLLPELDGITDSRTRVAMHIALGNLLGTHKDFKRLTDAMRDNQGLL